MARRTLFYLGALTLLSGCEGTSGPLLERPEAEEPAFVPDLPLISPGRGLDPDGAFQIQLSDGVDTAVPAETIVIDLHAPSDDEFAELAERQGDYVACYFSAGSFEPWRPDADAFPEEIRGNALPDYPNEEWLDVSAVSTLELMGARMDLAMVRGCDAVYPSIVRPTVGNEDFELTDEDFLLYGEALAEEAHKRDLGAFYAGGAEIDEAASNFDVVLLFGCVERGDCDESAALAGPAVIFGVEYAEPDAAEAACPDISPPWQTIVKRENLDAFRFLCPRN